MGSIYQKLTESDIEKIKAELHERICVTRHEILEEVKEARAQGDYSENYELYAAKRAKGQNESRIRYLQNVLKNATIISDESPVDEVGINNTVTIYYPEDDEEETYKITTSIRANSMEDRLDMESPRQECANKEQRLRRQAFYLRNGFRETNVYRSWDDLEMTIMMMGPGTFTLQNWDEIVGELRKYWTWD